MIWGRLTIIITSELEGEIALGLATWSIRGVELGVRLLSFVYIAQSINHLHVNWFIFGYIHMTVIINSWWDQHWRHLEHVLYVLWSLHWFSLAGSLGALLRLHLVSFYYPHAWFVVAATNAQVWACHLPLSNFDVVPHAGVSVLLISRTDILIIDQIGIEVDELGRFDFCLRLVDRFQFVMWKLLSLRLNFSSIFAMVKWHFGGAEARLCLRTMIVIIRFVLRRLLIQIERRLLFYSYFRALFWAQNEIWRVHTRMRCCNIL